MAQQVTDERHVFDAAVERSRHDGPVAGAAAARAHRGHGPGRRRRRTAPASRRCTAAKRAGRPLADRMRLPFPILEPLIERARAERLIEVRGAIGSGTAGYRYALTDLGRERARQYLDVNQYVGPRRCRWPPTSRRCARWPPRAATSIASGCARLLAPDRRTTRARAARAGGQRRQGRVPLRPARQRQDRDRRRHGRVDRRRHVHPARDRRGRPRHHDVRPDQPRSARQRDRAERGVERHRDRRRAIAAGSGSGGRS